ncbi:Phosphoenolpyruvate carboxykinase [Picochlorum sp. SENEW3]|nr:Phosphoenolpyruvate carboxykinase [Picochlorum sp. SENEW3]WPT14852.1 Phosphoenolpyruvate carboxykinase [Picochlorum sp. SENEW3]
MSTGLNLSSVVGKEGGDGKRSDDLRRLVNEAHPPRASDLEELQGLQKTQKERDEAKDEKRQESIAQTLRSKAVNAGPRVITKEPRHLYLPQSPRSRAKAEAEQTDVVREMFHDMSDVGLKPVVVYHNLTVAEYYEHALKYEKSSHITSTGALATLSGAKTGRSPKDKRVVKDPESMDDIWWGKGSPNFEMDEHTFRLNRERAVDYLNMLDRIYVFDGFAGWDPASRLKIRVVSARPYHALFMNNMLIRPSEEELAEFGTPDFTIYNAGAFPANRYTSYMTSSSSIDVSLEHKEMIILGTQYAGEMKKGVFSLMNYWLPKRGILSLHSGCNVGQGGDVTMFFGLSGTGKTTLSADPKRPLIGDDEHGWGDTGVFNIEGGCYAKAIGLKRENEPEIFDAIKFGTILENVVFDDETRVVDYESNSITENTRASYPIEFIDNAHIPCVAGHPKNIIMLCCDAFGVLPPVSKLTKEQAMYYFISGYTAKVAGTEMGVTEPEATFSACFGSAFLMWHPTKYASMLAEKMEKHGTTAWLINTGWTGGSYGTGYRFKLRHTRAIVDAIHNGELLEAEYESMPVFNLQVPKAVTNVPTEVLMPSNSWVDKEAYNNTLANLAGLFKENFVTYQDGGGHVTPDEAHRILAAGPHMA